MEKEIKKEEIKVDDLEDVNGGVRFKASSIIKVDPDSTDEDNDEDQKKRRKVSAR